jgi:hypothetical protein
MTRAAHADAVSTGKLRRQRSKGRAIPTLIAVADAADSFRYRPRRRVI